MNASQKPLTAKGNTMPLWVSLYLAVMLLSLPVGLAMLRKIEQDWLHPVGGLVSTLLSMAFVVSYWNPDALPFTSVSTVFLLAFVLFWDAYSLFRLRKKLPELFEKESPTQDQPPAAAWIMGLALMAPAYYFGALVCLRVMTNG